MDQEAPVADLPQFLLDLLDDRRAARHRGVERCGRWEHSADRIASLAWRRQFYRDTNSERRASALLSHRLRAAARQGLRGVDLYDHILGHLRGTYRGQVLESPDACFLIIRSIGCSEFLHRIWKWIIQCSRCLTTAHDCSRLLTTPQACDSCSACICCQDICRHILLFHRDFEARMQCTRNNGHS